MGKGMGPKGKAARKVIEEGDGKEGFNEN